MTSQTTQALAAEALRAAFDHSFSELRSRRLDDTDDVLRIGVAGEAYAVALAEIAGLYVRPLIVPVPSPLPEFVGVTALRSQIVPVYDVAGLLGHPRTTGPVRWLLLARASVPVAFAVDNVEGHLRVARTSILPRQGQDVRVQVPTTLRTPEGSRGIVSLPALIQLLQDRIRATGTSKEQ
jgi:purine-binding chemotaxis protein CheW